MHLLVTGLMPSGPARPPSSSSLVGRQSPRLCISCFATQQTSFGLRTQYEWMLVEALKHGGITGMMDRLDNPSKLRHGGMMGC